MDVAILWFVFAICVGIIAAARGRSGVGWWFLSMLLSPLIGIIMVALLPIQAAPGDPAGTDLPTRSCPFCAEPIRLEAIKCKHCGSAVDPAPREAAREDASVTASLPYRVGARVGRILGRGADRTTNFDRDPLG